MAEDGLLMNFAIDDAPLNTKPVFKGGRWKDRLQAKKSLQRRGQKQQSNGALTGVNAIPTKNRILPDQSKEHPSAKRQKTSISSAHNQQFSAPRTDVISSLFTSNPTSKSNAKEEIPDNDFVPLPSNAPLPEGASQFTTLGLSPTLATHLLTSLSLKTPTAIQKSALTHLLAEDSDAFIQAETGSGKTLAYLLPIIQRLTALQTTNPTADEKTSSPQNIDRKSGLFALILAPTRELARQIDTILSALLRRLPWIVHGTVTGGATKNHEKARIRKGINILVATPGRLVDHLDNTEALDIKNVRWLVLDEGDRLVELGFEEDIGRIVEALDKKEGKVGRARGESEEEIGEGKKRVLGLPQKRTTVLCSATMKMGVQKLGDMSLNDAVLIKADPALEQPESLSNGEDAKESAKDDLGQAAPAEEEKERPFLAPAQLKQSYIIAPAKQRLVTLTALLKRTFARKGSVTKAIVFVSCADSADYYFEVYARKEKEVEQCDLTSSSVEKPSRNDKSARKGPKEENATSQSCEQGSNPDIPKTPRKTQDLSTLAAAPTLSSPQNTSLKIYKLHGSLPQPLRTATLASFSRTPDPAILLCTDVASRGLDLPNIDLVIEYDPAFSSDDHLHRVGRTARAGREGRATCFLMPGPEEGYADVLKAGAWKGAVKGESADDVLRKGFTPPGLRSSRKDGVAEESAKRWDERATDWQLDVERWVIDDKRAGEMARKAYVSHVRAYATHAVKERSMFDVKELHLGHLAKAFALREKPGSMGRGGSEKGGKGEKGRRVERRHHNSAAEAKGSDAKGYNDEYENVRPDWRGDLDTQADGKDAAKRMRAKMKEHMASAGEFNIG